MDSLLLVVPIALMLFIYYYLYMSCPQKGTMEAFKKDVEDLIEELKESMESVEEIAKSDLEKLKDHVILYVEEKNTKEGYSFAKNYWPYYYYSYPYESEVAWPPGLYSRLYNWQPGFTTSGWTYALRPGLRYVRMPRARWFRNNGRYYYINNVY